ncbi:UNVERIFIED_CONTAM: pik3c3 [Trichonephila clavipes]
MYQIVMKRFSLTLQRGSPEYKRRKELLFRGRDFVEKLLSLLKTVARESGGRRKKTERLQALLLDKDIHKIDFLNFEPLPLPLDPSVKVKGIIPEKTTLFKSALMPTRLTFLTVDGKEYVTIFKLGDDLRQDQLILQTISLMDKLLQHENLDLKLTPYRVLACSSKHGKIFHIDFGYILGRDPKPMPPQMKLSKEMVDAMGGIHSDNYNMFRQYAVTAFLILRRHGNLFLNLFSLMVDASVPDIALEPDKTVKKVQDKFRFDLSEEECTNMIHTIIEESASAVMPAVVEQIHRIAQVS